MVGNVVKVRHTRGLTLVEAREADVDGDGDIDLNELAVLKNAAQQRQIDQADVVMMDSNNDGQVDEFELAVCEAAIQGDDILSKVARANASVHIG